MRIPSLIPAIGGALTLAAQAHAWHFLARGRGSYANHVTTGKLYTLAHEIADKLAEPARGNGIDLSELEDLGISGRDDGGPPGTFGGPEIASAVINTYLDTLDTLLADCRGRTTLDWLTNTVQEAQRDLNQILFLLELQ